MSRANANAFTERILAGETLQQIANSEGITRQRVSQILKDSGFSCSELVKERESKLLEKIKDLANKNFSLFEIADTLQLTYCQVRERCSKAGIKCKKSK